MNVLEHFALDEKKPGQQKSLKRKKPREALVHEIVFMLNHLTQRVEHFEFVLHFFCESDLPNSFICRQMLVHGEPPGLGKRKEAYRKWQLTFGRLKPTLP